VAVVDVNIVAYALITGAKTALARRVRELDPVWRLPELWQHEFLKALSTHTRHGGMSAFDADVLWREAIAWLSDCEPPVDMRKAPRLFIKAGVSAYDALYIILAQVLGVLCVTEDRKLARTFPNVATSMDVFCGP
jgi:predicted nucleic acid-binding protein